MTPDQWRHCTKITSEMQAAKARMLEAESKMNDEKDAIRKIQAKCPHLVTRLQTGGPERSSTWCVICESEID